MNYEPEKYLIIIKHINRMHNLYYGGVLAQEASKVSVVRVGSQGLANVQCLALFFWGFSLLTFIL